MYNHSTVKSGYLFVESLLNPSTGLAVSSAGELYTTIYKNALAAFVLIHEGNLKGAEKIFNLFQNYYNKNKDSFQGLPQKWNSETGMPDMTSIHWEGGAAFLLLALNYYKMVVKSFSKYEEFVQGLVTWLAQRAYSCDLILAEGVAEMNAALSPHSEQSSVQHSRARLRQCFFSTGQISSKDYEHNLYHIVRGMLVFGDITGCHYLNTFARCQSWKFVQSKIIQAYSALAHDTFINIEVSAQLLLAWKLWQSEVQTELTELHTTLENLFLPGPNNSQACGLPYTITNQVLAPVYAKPALEPTCFLLFYKWELNPFAPGKKCVETT